MFSTRLLTALSLLTSISMGSIAGVLDNKECQLIDHNSECLQYYLPFESNLRISDYIDAIESELDEQLINEAKAIARIDKSIENSKGLNSFMIEKQNLPKKDKPPHLKMAMLAILYICQQEGRKLYSEMPYFYLKQALHTLYTLTYGFYPDIAGDFTVFTEGPGYSFRRERAGGLYTVKTEIDGRIEYSTARFILLLINYLQQETYTHFIYDNQSIEWLLDYIPELRYKSVIELGAGNGQLSSILKAKGVNITATDIYPRPSAPVSDYNQILPLSAEQAINTYTNENTVFLSYVPGWDMTDIFKKLNQRKNWTLIIIYEDENVGIEYFRHYLPDAYIKIERLPSRFKTIYNLDELKPHIYKIQQQK